MDDLVRGLDIALCALGTLAAFGALNKAKVGVTRPCVIAAVFLIFLAMFGTVLAGAKGEWVDYLDIALKGGIVALILATQKLPTWIGERLANPIAMIVAGVAGLVFTAALFMSAAHAQQPAPRTPALPPFDCPRLAGVIEREVRRMWREGLDADHAALALYLRCIQQLGDMGVEG